MQLTLYTDRLKLSPLTAADVDIGLEMFTNPNVLRYAGGAMKPEFIRASMQEWTQRGGNGCIGIWTLSLRDGGEKLGSTALLPIPIDEDDTDFSLVVPGKMPDGEIEVGYFLKENAWGHGYATEACMRIIQFAFAASPLEEVIATIHEDNVASRNVLTKVGFTYRGTMRCYGEDNEPRYSITRAEWQQQNAAR